MRPCLRFLFLLGALLAGDALLLAHGAGRRAETEAQAGLRAATVAALGLTDLCLATEARYTRHPAVSDLLVPFMDHPGAMEHFPSGSFWAAPEVGGGRP